MSVSLVKDDPLYVRLKSEPHQDLFIHLSHKTFITWSVFWWPSVVLFTLFQILPLLQKSLSDGVSTCQSLQSDTLTWNKNYWLWIYVLFTSSQLHLFLLGTDKELSKNWWCELRAVIAQAISMNSIFKSIQRKPCRYTLLYHDHIHPPSCSLYNLTSNFSGQL